MPQSPSLLWDIFCRVIDNWGDLGVSWRLARQLAGRGERVRLWVDDAAPLAWMAPGGCPGVRVLPWTAPLAHAVLAGLKPADVWVEAFGCDPPPEFVAHDVAVRPHGTAPVWINLEYLSAEPWVERVHGLPSPVLHGPAAGRTKWFFHPGFTPATGGLLREDDLDARQAHFDKPAWLAAHGIAWQGERLVSLFCYEPPALADFLCQLAASPRPARLLVTAGRATVALRAYGAAAARLPLSELPLLAQDDYDALLWCCDFNAVRGEDSLVRALWAERPFVWQPYPQDDGVHRAKLEALLACLGGPEDWQRFHRVWSGLASGPLPPLDIDGWGAAVLPALRRVRAQRDLASELQGFVCQKS